ncbi:MAG: DUF1700 domain-containing protein [Oscillospiraceae bacterium]|nr:DUF1700 domain-containing protein [Oscillospiraceae bacterium]
MDKKEFLLQLKRKVSCLSKTDIDERLSFYSEMIEDRMEEGLAEDEAVAAVGSVEEIAAQILTDTPHPQATGAVASKKGLKAWQIVLLVLGSPLWLSLLLAAFSVVVALYISLWSIVFSLWAVFASFVACAFAGIVSGCGFALTGSGVVGFALLGAGILCAGLGVFLFFGCKAATWLNLFLTKKLLGWGRNCFRKKEAA